MEFALISAKNTPIIRCSSISDVFTGITTTSDINTLRGVGRVVCGRVFTTNAFVRSRCRGGWRSDTTVLGNSSHPDVFTGITTTSDINTLRCVGWVVRRWVLTTYAFGGGRGIVIIIIVVIIFILRVMVAMEFALTSTNTSISTIRH